MSDTKNPTDVDSFLSEVKEVSTENPIGQGFIRISDYLKEKRLTRARLPKGLAKPFSLRWRALEAYRRQKQFKNS